MADQATPGPRSAIEQIYDQLAQVFGGTNRHQLFTLMMPGTLIDADDFMHDTHAEKPARVARAESALTDQMFDIAKVSGSSNGQRVSSQYLQALSCLVPKFDVMLPDMKKTLREFVDAPAAADARVAGHAFKGTLAQHYFALYQHWLQMKSDWETRRMQASHERSPNDYLEWYERTAEGELAAIDAAYGDLLSVFSPADMDAIIGALDSGPGGEIDQAQRIVQDIRLPTPSGGHVYPVALRPSDWFGTLSSDIEPRDLLQDPEFIASTITVRRRAVQSSLEQVRAIVERMPQREDITQAVRQFDTERQGFAEAEKALADGYTDNTVTAVSIVMRALGGVAPTSGALDKFHQSCAAVGAAKGTPAADTACRRRDGQAFTLDDVNRIAAQQNALHGAQANLLTHLESLASAARTLAATRADLNDELPGLLAHLRSQLEELRTLEDHLGEAVIARGERAAAPPLPLAPTAADAVALKTTAAQARAAATQEHATYDTVVAAIPASPTGPMRDALLAAAKQAHDADPTAPATAIAKAIASCVDGLLAARAPSARRSVTSERFMTLRMAFSHDEVDRTDVSTSSTTVSERNFSFFFCGGASRSSSTFAQSLHAAMDASTSIEIAFQAAKVDVERDWLDPGLFKLTDAMHRLVQHPVTRPDDHGKGTAGLDDPAWVDSANGGLLPSIPVAFVVAKDVSIRFKATQAGLQAIRQVLDSSSASGGGFLCFSASSSNQSHGDMSGLHSRTDDTVVSITMPAPQILGWFLELMPVDGSEYLNQKAPKGDEPTISVIDFTRRMRALETPKTPALAAAPALPLKVAA